jgi:pimeloyl-ACP methyl ester carboxylesterase
VRRGHGLEVQIRVGLNSGAVVVRTIGNDLHMDYSAIGQTTHLAARMEQLASPGTIRLTADTLRSGLMQDRSQFYKDLATPFYGANRPGAKVSQGTLDQFWLWSMQAGLKNAYESIKAFSETDFTEDLKKIEVPTLVMHGEDDQIVPVKDSAVKSARLIKGAKAIYYPGAPHGLTATHQEQVNADLLAFIKA